MRGRGTVDATSYIAVFQRLLFPALCFGAAVLAGATILWGVRRQRELRRAERLLNEIQDEFYMELASMTDQYQGEDPLDDIEYDRAIRRAMFVKSMYTHIINDVSALYSGEKRKGQVRLK